MKSEIIYNFYEFLENEDKNFKNNGAIVDDGFEALYCLLFKLMGDRRTIPELLELMGMPHPAEFQGCAEEGDYATIIDLSIDYCDLDKNGANLEIAPEIIKKLESFVPLLTDRIKSGDWAKDEKFISSILN
tara:strand:- start:1539 stop:1931 length:393 start_codon:yes stop_codon:yes gene_type:complete